MSITTNDDFAFESQRSVPRKRHRSYALPMPGAKRLTIGQALCAASYWRWRNLSKGRAKHVLQAAAAIKTLPGGRTGRGYIDKVTQEDVSAATDQWL